MKTLITNVTLQINEVTKSQTVFTDYKIGQTEYDGFTPYKTLEEAIEAAKIMVKTENNQFISNVNGYDVIVFKKDGTKSKIFAKV